MGWSPSEDATTVTTQATPAPDWLANKVGMVTEIHRELERRDTWQGKALMKGHTLRAQEHYSSNLLEGTAP